ncbi:DUF1998 domain-containing protein [Streptomyces carpaticus]|uniref:DUF1998 domain-containing protein n=1 Tax=Streptomyces carpaticus TaxID=285558 RepID=UPI0022072C48|nr:DUF1998 domain-containing protein [Streptomyces carpaticus]
MTGGTFRRVGSTRPSHVMYSGGVGAVVDLPNFSVLVKGLDSWYHQRLLSSEYLVHEPRLLTAVNRVLGRYGADRITELRTPPWAEGADTDPGGEAAQRIGVPVDPFPRWLRCTGCHELATVDSGAFDFHNPISRAPHEARYVHSCPQRKNGKALAVTTRFTLVCRAGHLDEFPYLAYVHRGRRCQKSAHPRLRMHDNGGNQAANVSLECVACGERRNVRHTLGERGKSQLPRCRGRHPHLDTFEAEGCAETPVLMVAGASNQWFPVTLNALALPPSPTAGLATQVAEKWEQFRPVTNADNYKLMSGLPGYEFLLQWPASAVIAAVRARQAELDGPEPGEPAKSGRSRVDLLTPEWKLFTAEEPPDATEDFALRDSTVPEGLTGLFSRVRQVERLREVRTLIGFTRLDPAAPEDPEQVARVPLHSSPSRWMPAGEVRGEGIFVQVSEELLADWAARVAGSAEMTAHRDAYARFRENRYSGRLTEPFEPMDRWPGTRYIALHTLSHLLIRTIALECGYSSASLAERIYAGDEHDPRGGILLYTAVPDAEGTLGGLVSLAEPAPFERIVRRALSEAMHCSSDPLCAERLPQHPYDYLHGAACHVCLFVSETTCERGNRYLDRRFLVPLSDDPALVLTPTALLP